MNNTKRRSALKIMGALIILVKPLIPVMFIAVSAGIAGFLCAIFLTIIGGQAIIAGLQHTVPDFARLGSPFLNIGIGSAAAILIVLAVMRGILHCIEQYCNHYIAFKLLAVIRNTVFSALRKLAPAKLEGKDKGNLIALITTDIELLEVFYAHTISPILIAAGTSICMLCFFASYHIYTMWTAFAAYLIVGIAIPLYTGKKTADAGMQFRNRFGALNSFVLEALRGLDEVMQYGAGSRIQRELHCRSEELAHDRAYLSKQEGRQTMMSSTAILFFSFVQLFLSLHLFQTGIVTFSAVLAVTVGMFSSFGPVLALAQLSGNLHQTLASGERVLSLLEEKPHVCAVPDDGRARVFSGAEADSLSFSYTGEVILNNYHLTIAKNTITGIHGKSGSGKSTLLKLFMRFWDPQSGCIRISSENITHIPTACLRSLQCSVTQETHLFKGTIADNIKTGKPAAGEEAVWNAAQKASIHDFIMSLPKGYETPVGELGDTLSGGEKQRIGLARAFLYDAPFMLLDEPTSNLDALNEKIILKSLKEASAGKTILLVSHRESALHISDSIITMKKDRIS